MMKQSTFIKPQAKYKVAYVYLGKAHDEYADVVQALRACAVEANLVHLNELEQINWAEYDLVNVRMSRGFHLDPTFLEKIQRLYEILQNLHGKVIPLVNSLDLILSGVDKAIYMQALEKDGIALIPTVWIKRGEQIVLEEIMSKQNWDDVVIKPTIASRSWGAFRVSRSSVESKPIDSQYILSEPPEKSKGKKMPEYAQRLQQLLEKHDICVQQFMPAILTQGETSFVFIDGLFSHAVQKTVGAGHWFAHELFGGVNKHVEPSSEALIWAERVYKHLVKRYGNLMFARIDGITDTTGKLLLLECELVVPRLFLSEGKALERYAHATINRLRTPLTVS